MAQDREKVVLGTVGVLGLRARGLSFGQERGAFGFDLATCTDIACDR
jgi:hypothetical protein